VREPVNFLREPLRERHPAAPDSNKGKIFGSAGLFNDFVRHAPERSGDFLGGQKLSFFYDAHSGASS
jgi:hypothetical protein